MGKKVELRILFNFKSFQKFGVRARSSQVVTVRAWWDSGLIRFIMDSI